MAVSLLLAPSASSAPIVYGSFSGTVINFDTLAGSTALGGGEILANQYSGLGVTFSAPNFNAFATTGPLATASAFTSQPNVIWVDQNGGSPSAQGLVINFSTPQAIVGLFVEGSLTSTFTLQVYNGASLLESTTSALGAGGVGLEGFLAIQNSNITKAIVFSTNPGGAKWNFSIDNLKFAATAVPEPGSVALLFAGLAAMAVARGRRLEIGSNAARVGRTP